MSDPQAAALEKAREWLSTLGPLERSQDYATDNPIGRWVHQEEVAALILAEREAERAACEQIARGARVLRGSLAEAADAIAARKGTP